MYLMLSYYDMTIRYVLNCFYDLYYNEFPEFGSTCLDYYSLELRWMVLEGFGFWIILEFTSS